MSGAGAAGEECVLAVTCLPRAPNAARRYRPVTTPETPMPRLLFFLLILLTGGAAASGPVFDVHVHIRNGEASLRDYLADVESSGVELSGLGAMWFGGPHQARQGELDAIRTGNDSIIALAKAHPRV